MGQRAKPAPRRARRASLVVVGIATLGAVAWCGDERAVTAEPECSYWPYIPIRATSGSLVVRVTTEDLACPLACLDTCPVVGLANGTEVVECRPGFREEGTEVSRASFVIENQEYPESATTYRIVRIAATTPDLSFVIRLPDVRSLEGEHAWSSPLIEAQFRSVSCYTAVGSDAAPVVGRLRVISRTGGAAGEDGVTDDYHAVVEVTGHVERLGNISGGPCPSMSETEFSFTYEESEVAETGLCLL